MLGAQGQAAYGQRSPMAQFYSVGRIFYSMVLRENRASTYLQKTFTPFQALETPSMPLDIKISGISHLRLSSVSCAYALRMPHQPLVSEFSGSTLTMHKQSSYTLQMTADVPVDSKPKPWLLVGLGNPGKLYSGTRHNVGFEMIDTIAQAEGISVSRMQSKALFGKGHINGNPVMLAKPQTFMNVSGESVGPLVAYYKIPLNQVLLIFDDMDLPFATLRLLPKGGHGGHNGMKSVIDHFKGNREFPRLRIGIGRPPGKMDAVGYVLRQFTKDEREEMDFTLQDGLDAIRILINQGFDKSATIVNRAQKARIQNS